jgi:DNA polymerase III subunit beta
VESYGNPGGDTVELKVAQNEFLKALETVGSVVSVRPTLPILGNVMIEVRKGEAVLTATDLEVRIELKVKASVKREGKLTVPAKKLLEIIREMPVEEIQVEFDSAARMLLKAGKCEFKMLGLPPDEFPQCPEVKRVAEIKVGAKVLVEMIKKTIYSVSADETRYVLNGALLEWEKGELRMITTDGRRLAFMKRPMGAAGGKGEAIVPTKALQELAVLLSATEGDVAVMVGEGYARFSTGEMDLVTRLIDGTFQIGRAHV